MISLVSKYGSMAKSWVMTHDSWLTLCWLNITIMRCQGTFVGYLYLMCVLLCNRGHPPSSASMVADGLTNSVNKRFFEYLPDTCPQIHHNIYRIQSSLIIFTLTYDWDHHPSGRGHWGSPAPCPGRGRISGSVHQTIHWHPLRC